jgi:hypothetical protein
MGSQQLRAMKRLKKGFKISNKSSRYGLLSNNSFDFTGYNSFHANVKRSLSAPSNRRAAALRQQIKCMSSSYLIIVGSTHGCLVTNPDVLAVANPARLRMGEFTLINARRTGWPDPAYAVAAYMTKRMPAAEVYPATAVSKVYQRRNVASLCWNASSICLASAAVKLLLAPRTRSAQVAASSAEPMSPRSAASWSRRATEASALRIDGEGREMALARRSIGFSERPCPPFRRLFFSAPAPEAVGAFSFGPSISSSPAIPTKVKRT